MGPLYGLPEDWAAEPRVLDKVLSRTGRGGHTHDHLGDNEGVPGGLGVLLGALEPALVTRLRSRLDQCLPARHKDTRRDEYRSLSPTTTGTGGLIMKGAE